MIRRSLIVAATCVTFGVPCSAQTRSPIDSNTPWTLAAAGDVIMNRRLTQFDHPGDPGFYQMAQHIRAADAAFMNLEQSIFRLQDFDGWPAAENGGNYEVGSPETLRDLVDINISSLHAKSTIDGQRPLSSDINKASAQLFPSGIPYVFMKVLEAKERQGKYLRKVSPWLV